MRPVMLIPVAAGLAATALAAIAVMGWSAIGSLFIKRVSKESPLFLPGSILIGAGLTSTVLAAAARSGWVRECTLAVAIAATIALIVRRRIIADQVRRAAGTVRAATNGWPAGRLLTIGIVFLGWIYAIAPPRDGDVMRYHLAHIRQIISDGAWLPISDLTYALPFAWSLNYLPFELIGLPQAAHIVNLLIGIVVAITLIRISPEGLSPRTSVLVVLVFLAHPFIVRTFTSALADAYAILAATVVVAALVRVDSLDEPLAALIGFCTWIGIGSRYQLVAVGLAGTAVVVFHLARARNRNAVGAFLTGGAVAILLASPFYIANFAAFGNPVWPLLVTRAAAGASYANEVAFEFMRGYSSSTGPDFRFGNAIGLIRTVDMAPIPLAIASLIIVSLISARLRMRHVASFGALFLLLWELMSPRLYPTHILPLLAVGPVLLAAVVASTQRAGVAHRIVNRALTLCVVTFAGVAAFFSVDYLRYAVTGNADEFHKYTWYYRTYAWANNNTPPDSRFLVVALSGHSYYLDRPYRRADPWLSGEVDWSRVDTPEALVNVMSRRGFDHIIFDDRNWSLFPGGWQMGRVIRDALADSTLVPIHYARELLYTSRVRRVASRANVYVLRLPLRSMGNR